MLLRAGCAAGRVRRRNCNGCQLLLTLYDYGGTGGADNVAAVVVDADAVRLRLVLHGCTADVVRLTLARRYMTNAGAGTIRLTLALYGVRLAQAQTRYD